jgi:two-component sensor histidine kinase
MAAEMAQRMKNMLTIAQVVVSQSLRNASDMGVARDAIRARLRALGEAQNVLTKVEHRNAPIADVVKAALLAHADASQVSASGDAFDLNPQQVLGLSLALHELGTNAVKYGSLSSKDGRVDIRWTNALGRFHLEWREAGGPEVLKSSASGFGSTILTKVVGGYFEGETTLTFEPEGLVYQISGSL